MKSLMTVSLTLGEITAGLPNGHLSVRPVSERLWPRFEQYVQLYQCRQTSTCLVVAIGSRSRSCKGKDRKMAVLFLLHQTRVVQCVLQREEITHSSIISKNAYCK